MMKFTLLSCVLIALVARSGAQMPGPPYPTNRTTCDYNTCTGCAPFEPPPGAPQDLLCGVDDVFFPVPTLIMQNDTSPTKELYPVRWLCVACCTVNCGFNNLGSHCRWRNYKYNASATNTYGCVHCSTKGTLQQFGGTVTTQFAMQSTGTVYKSINLGFGLCGQFDQLNYTTPAMGPTPATMSPTPTTMSPTPTTMSPTPAAMSPTPAAMSPTPAAGTPSPAAGTPSPAAGTPSPAAGTPSPAAGTPSPATSSPQTVSPSATSPAPKSGAMSVSVFNAVLALALVVVVAI